MKLLLTGILLAIPALLIGFSITPVVAAEEAAGEAAAARAGAIGMKFFSAAIAFAAAALAAGMAIGKAGAAGLAGTAEKLEVRTTAIIISALGEALGIYGIVVSLLIIGSPV